MIFSFYKKLISDPQRLPISIDRGKGDVFHSKVPERARGEAILIHKGLN